MLESRGYSKSRWKSRASNSLVTRLRFKIRGSRYRKRMRRGREFKGLKASISFKWTWLKVWKGRREKKSGRRGISRSMIFS